MLKKNLNTRKLKAEMLEIGIAAFVSQESYHIRSIDVTHQFSFPRKTVILLSLKNTKEYEYK